MKTIYVVLIFNIPIRLDSRPKKMFENFVRRTLEDQVYKVTYLDDQKLFEFGPIFVGMNRLKLLIIFTFTNYRRNLNIMAMKFDK